MKNHRMVWLFLFLIFVGCTMAVAHSGPPQKAKHEDAPPSASNTNMPDLKTTADFLNRMVEPEDRRVLLGVLAGAEPHSLTGPANHAITILSNRQIFLLLPKITYNKDDHPEIRWFVLADSFFLSDSDKKQEDYPRYMTFSLRDIDPTSIGADTGGFDVSFSEKQPKCEADSQCMMSFLETAPKLTSVKFHTTDLKPVIERGGCSETSGYRLDCSLSNTTDRVVFAFKDKDRAERFVTALTYAVKLEGGKPDLFPPSH